MADAGDPVRDGDALVYIGRDDRGVEREIVAVPDNRRSSSLAVSDATPTGWRTK